MLFIAACSWGVAIPIMKVLEGEQNLLAPEVGSITGSIASLAVRFTGAALILMCLSPFSTWRITRTEYFHGLILGLLTAVSMALQLDGLNYTSASTAGFLIAMYCVFIPLFTWAFGRRRMTGILGLCCLLVMAGMAILSDVDPLSFSLGRGEWESLAAAVLFACQILWVDGLTPGTYNPSRLTFVLCATVAVFCCMALAILPGGIPSLSLLHSSVRSWILTAALTVFGTTLPFLIMNHFQSKVGAITAGFIYCFEPITSAGSALFLPLLLGRAGTPYGNESFSMRLMIGGGLVLAANIFLLFDRPKPTRI